MDGHRPRPPTRISTSFRFLRQRLSRLETHLHRRRLPGSIRESSRQEMTTDQPKYKTSEVVDFVIVGSGAAGGVLAKELSTNGFSVVVLEQGPYLTPKISSTTKSKFSRKISSPIIPSCSPILFARRPTTKPSFSALWFTAAPSAAPAITSPQTFGASTKSISRSAANLAPSPAPLLSTGLSPTPILSRTTPKLNGKSASPVSP